MTRAYSPIWLTIALAASLGLIVVSPFVGQFNVWLRDAAQGNYTLVLGVSVAVPALTLLLVAAWSIRERHLRRYGWLAGALALAVGFGFASRTGVADTDAAERFHFVEYGLLALLFYKAWRPSGDGAVIAIPVLSGFIVGTFEEWLQWFVPGRVGEIKDVVLNLVSVSAGLLFAIGLDPPDQLTSALTRPSRRRVALLATAAVVVFAAFFQSVHLGHEIADRDAGVFRSRYSRDELLDVGQARSVRWRSDPPLTWSRFSREDQYLTEGVAHVRRRNQRWDEGSRLAARQENLILEKYYAPVLDTPSYISSSGHRWPSAQRSEAEQIRGPGFMIYVSDALDYPVVTWPPVIYWLVIAVAIVLMLRRML